jgi:lysozyme family protein
MNAFEKAWAKTGRAEGGYVNNPKDSGGPTNHGISEQVARAHGYLGDMRDLPRDRALEIAKEQYWDIMRLDEVATLSGPVAEEMFDSGFLCGQATVVIWLQRLLNVANRQAFDYPEVKADGLMGKLSIASMRAFLKKRGSNGEVVLFNSLNGLQSAFLTELAERRQKDEEFWFGWQLNRIDFLKRVSG